MIDASDRDRLVGDALRRLPVPDHGPRFWQELDGRLGTGAAERSELAPAAPAASPPPQHGRVLPLSADRTDGRRRRVTAGLGVAALAAVVLGFAATVAGDRGSDTAGVASAPTTTATDVPAPDPTTGPAAAAAPFAAPGAPATAPPDQPAVGAGTPERAVLAWLDELGAGDVDAAAARTGPRSAAYLEALGEDLEGFLRESTEGWGSWAGAADRTTTEVPLPVEGGEDVVLVVVSGTRPGEGREEARTDVLPAVRGADGTWLVEPVAFDPDTGGRLELVSPAPGEDGLGPLAPDAAVEVLAPGDGTFFFSLEDGAVAEVPGQASQGAVRARWDPPGSLPAQRHLLVIGYVDGATITGFAGAFEVVP